MALKTPPLVANRDFVFKGTAAWSPEKRAVTLSFGPAEDKEVPLGDDIVRGRVLGGGYVLKPLDGGKTWTEYGVNVDPSGAIPTWVVNFVSQNTPFNTLEHVRDQVQRPDVRITDAVRALVKPYRDSTAAAR